MKKLIISFVFTGLLIAGSIFMLHNNIDELFNPPLLSEEVNTEVFSDEEIEKLNNYESELYQRLGSTKESAEYNHYFTYFEIPDSVKYTHEFTFYLLEFRDIKEIHALGISDDNHSFVAARSLNNSFLNERNL